LNKYEGMIIFSEAIKDASLEAAIGRLKTEIKKFDGEVDSTTRLGKRQFARRMKKKDSGHYVQMAFRMKGDNLAPFLAKLKLNEEIFRAQVVRAVERKAAPAAVEKSKDDNA